MPSGGDRPFEGRRVLVVEDEYIVALDLEDTLRALGCEVLGPVASVARALALLALERPDAVTLDLDLLDGLAVPVAELLASMGVPFVVVSAYGAGSVDHPVLKQAPRLSKPFGRGRPETRAGTVVGGRQPGLRGSWPTAEGWRVGSQLFVPGGTAEEGP